MTKDIVKNKAKGKAGGRVQMTVTQAVWKLIKPFKRHVYIVVGLMLLAQLAGVASPFINSKLIDSVVGKAPGENGYLLLVVAFSVWLLSILISRFQDVYEIKHLDFAVGRAFDRDSMNKILGFSIGQHKRDNSALRANISGRGNRALMDIYKLTAYQIFPQSVTALVTVIAMIVVNPLLGIILLIGMVAYGYSVVRDVLAARAELKAIEDRWQEYGKRQSEVIRHAPLVIANAQEERFSVELDTRRAGIDADHVALATRLSGNFMKRQVLLGSVQYIIFGIGFYLVSIGAETPGKLLVFWLWSSNAIGTISSMFWLQRQFLDAITGARKYLEMASVTTDVPEAENPVDVPKFRGEVEFRNVSYSYHSREVGSDESGNEVANPQPKQKQSAITNVSFHIMPGERVAFVGESGAGKSTIIATLMREHDPDLGQVLIDGVDLRLLRLKSYLRAVGKVEQDVTLFDDTLRRNILFGVGEAASLVSDDELRHACKVARVDGFFSKLEKGFETMIGERGVKLSGGERQRVAIARALVKDPSILILDEATSSLDAANEAEIREALNEASKGRTTIIIAHRFSTIKHVDRIYVVDGGRISDVGTHDELMKHSARYKELVRHQLAS